MNTTDKITALRDALTVARRELYGYMSVECADKGTEDAVELADKVLALTADASEDAPDCCDTPNYCSAARRCTAKDEAPGMVFDPLARHNEQKLREMLADLHREYRDRAEPLVKHLVAIEALKPPAPLMIDWPAAPAAPIAEEAGGIVRNTLIINGKPEQLAELPDATDHYGIETFHSEPVAHDQQAGAVDGDAERRYHGKEIAAFANTAAVLEQAKADRRAKE